MKRILLVAAVAFSQLAAAETYTGKVVSVVDGDTLKILTADRQELKIRLTEIDAPEKKQPFGQQSKEALASICAGQQAHVESAGKDRYKRILGRVKCNGVDANAEMIRLGMAWVYTQYNKDKSLLPLQAQAKQSRIGLWRDAGPLPPWEFRHR